jgi:hypothetical protein
MSKPNEVSFRGPFPKSMINKATCTLGHLKVGNNDHGIAPIVENRNLIGALKISADAFMRL